MASGSKFCIWEVEGLYCVAKTKALISFAVTVQLICVFVFAYARFWFSHDAAHIILYKKIFNIRNSLMNCYNIV